MDIASLKGAREETKLRGKLRETSFIVWKSQFFRRRKVSNRPRARFTFGPAKINKRTCDSGSMHNSNDVNYGVIPFFVPNVPSEPVRICSDPFSGAFSPISLGGCSMSGKIAPASAYAFGNIYSAARFPRVIRVATGRYRSMFKNRPNRVGLNYTIYFHDFDSRTETATKKFIQSSVTYAE